MRGQGGRDELPAYRFAGPEPPPYVEGSHSELNDMMRVGPPTQNTIHLSEAGDVPAETQHEGDQGQNEQSSQSSASHSQSESLHSANSHQSNRVYRTEEEAFDRVREGRQDSASQDPNFRNDCVIN